MFAPFFIEFQLYRAMRSRFTKEKWLPAFYMMDIAIWLGLGLIASVVMGLIAGSGGGTIDWAALLLVVCTICLVCPVLFTTVSWFVWLKPSEKEGRGEEWMMKSMIQKAEALNREMPYTDGYSADDLRKMSRKWNKKR